MERKMRLVVAAVEQQFSQEKLKRRVFVGFVAGSMAGSMLEGLSD